MCMYGDISVCGSVTVSQYTNFRRYDNITLLHFVSKGRTFKLMQALFYSNKVLTLQGFNHQAC
jgi:hypothetical protein